MAAYVALTSWQVCVFIFAAMTPPSEHEPMSPCKEEAALTTPGQQGVIRQVDKTLAITTAAQPSLAD